jgi:hypothetical protein
VTLTELTEAYIRARLEAPSRPAPKPEPKPEPPKVVMPPVKKTTYDPDRILAAVATVHGVTVEAIRGKSRKFPVLIARHHATWMLKHRTDLSLVTIAVVTNRICHSSAINSVQTFEAYKARYASHIEKAEATLASTFASQLVDA